MTRDEEILVVLKAITNVEGIYEDNSWTSSCVNTVTCPFCDKHVKEYSSRDEKTMEDIEHKQDCPYLIAKDLTTNL